MNPFERKTPADAGHGHPRSVELYNDATHDSTVDTDGKNREAARIANGEPISPDQITTSNASLVNAMPETPDGFAGFDSRPGGNHPQFAPRAGYTVVDKGFDAAAPGGGARGRRASVAVSSAASAGAHHRVRADSALMSVSSPRACRCGVGPHGVIAFAARSSRNRASVAFLHRRVHASARRIRFTV